MSTFPPSHCPLPTSLPCPLSRQDVVQPDKLEDLKVLARRHMSMFRCVALCSGVWLCVQVHGSVFRCVALCEVRGSVFRCVALCSGAWLCVRVRGSVPGVRLSVHTIIAFLDLLGGKGDIATG